jgi:hypothetical protein
MAFQGRKNMNVKFYESIDQCWHQISIVMKHVKYLSQFENNIELLEKQLISKQ